MAGGVVNQPALLDMPRPQRRVRASGGTDVTVGDGGTGVSTLADGGVMVGSGSNAVTVLSRLTNNQMMVGQTSGDPLNESGATLRASIGTHAVGDNNTFTGNNSFSGTSTFTGDGTHSASESFSDDLLIAAISGIIETNSNFVDFQVFGPALDPVKDWHIKLGASVATDLMLVTVEDTGANTDVTIWDLTDPTVVGATPLATVTLTGDATVTSVAAAMGYIIVGSEDGITIIDPHDGSWAERTVGWPKSLSTSTTPALTDNDVQDVTAGFSDQPRFDPRTGGPMPTFGLSYGAGADISSLIKDDGNVFDRSGTVGNAGCSISQGHFFFVTNTSGDPVFIGPPISQIQADDWANQDIFRTDTQRQGLGVTAALDIVDTGLVAGAGALGLSLGILLSRGQSGSDFAAGAITAAVNRTFNTGWLVDDIRGAWLANSKTADRSYKANTLTEGGTVPEVSADAASGELKAYGPFTTTNKLTRASDADWDVITTGAACLISWFKSSGTAGGEQLIGFSNAGNTLRFILAVLTNGTVQGIDDGASASTSAQTTESFDGDGGWHMAVFVRRSSTEREMWVDGVLHDTDTTDAGSLTSSGNLPLGVGINADGTATPALTTLIALARLTATAPSAAQIRHMYETERRMFETGAKCLLQSASTDAVLDVNIDPITGRVGVTQTDDVVVFDGLIVVSEPSIPSGGTTREHYALYGGDSFEITNANLNAIIAAKDIRQELDRLRGERLPKGPDLGRAKALLSFNQAGPTIEASMNIKSVTDTSAGLFTVFFEVPFKNTTYFVSAVAGVDDMAPPTFLIRSASNCTFSLKDIDGILTDSTSTIIFYGELENE